MPPIEGVGAHDDPLVFFAEHFELVGFAEYVASPFFVKVTCNVKKNNM